MQVESQPAQPPVPKFGKPAPSRIPAYKLGPNVFEHQVGPHRVRDVLWLDEQDVRLTLATFRAQGVVLPIYKEHNPAFGSFGSMRLDLAADGGIDQVIDWNARGASLVESGEYMFDSPEVVMTEPGPDGKKHLREIRSGSLVNKPARTGSRPLLMSANGVRMNEQAMTARKALEHLGALESCVKQMTGASHAKLKEAAEQLSPVMGNAAACMRAALEDLDQDGMSAGGEISKEVQTTSVTTMSAEARAMGDLGASVVKMSGAAAADQALGWLEAQMSSVQALKDKIVEMGAELGVQGMTGDAERFKKYSPGQLLGYMSAAPRIQGLGAGREAEQKDERKRHAEVDADVDKMLTRALARNGVKYGSK